MLQLRKVGRGRVVAPCGEAVKGAEALALPALLPLAPRVGTEQDAVRLERCVQREKNARQLGARHMKEHGVGEHTIELGCRQVQCQQVLLPDDAAAVRARQGRNLWSVLQTDGLVAQLGEGLEVSSRAATQVQDAQRRSPLDVS